MKKWSKPKKKIFHIILLLAISGVGMNIILTSFSDKISYYVTPNELNQDHTKFFNKEIKLGGMVKNLEFDRVNQEFVFDLYQIAEVDLKINKDNKLNQNKILELSEQKQYKAQYQQSEKESLIREKESAVTKERSITHINDLQQLQPIYVQVRYRGILPGLFQENQMAIALGKINASKIFIAREVLAKHDENYRPPK